MNEKSLAKLKRSAELEAMTSIQLTDLITAMGWRMDGRQNKTNRKLAILHLEKHQVIESIVEELRLVKLEPIT